MNSFKKILEGLKTGVGVGLGIFVILFIGLYITKAALPTANTGDKLTSAKRNDVINEVNLLKTTVTALSSVPAGQVSAFNLSSCPTGRIPANGSNSTPDLRGEFIRGLDGGRGIDSGRTLGSSQTSTQVLVDNDANEVVGAIDWTNNNLTNLGYESSTSTSVSVHYNTSTFTQAMYGDFLRSIRPRNVALLYCVKQ